MVGAAFGDEKRVEREGAVRGSRKNGGSTRVPCSCCGFIDRHYRELLTVHLPLVSYRVCSGPYQGHCDIFLTKSTYYLINFQPTRLKKNTDKPLNKYIKTNYYLSY